MSAHAPPRPRLRPRLRARLQTTGHDQRVQWAQQGAIAKLCARHPYAPAECGGSVDVLRRAYTIWAIGAAPALRRDLTGGAAGAGVQGARVQGARAQGTRGLGERGGRDAGGHAHAEQGAACIPAGGPRRAARGPPDAPTQGNRAQPSPSHPPGACFAPAPPGPPALPLPPPKKTTSRRAARGGNAAGRQPRVLGRRVPRRRQGVLHRAAPGLLRRRLPQQPVAGLAQNGPPLQVRGPPPAARGEGAGGPRARGAQMQGC
jgi:hypothetical protein